MKAKNFDLGFYCLGNGVTVVNRAVKESGDYKMIAHISNAGKIKYYVDIDYIHEDAMKRIQGCAETNKKEFIATFNRRTKEQQYAELMNNDKVFMKFLYDRRYWEERLEEMKDYYFSIA